MSRRPRRRSKSTRVSRSQSLFDFLALEPRQMLSVSPGSSWPNLSAAVSWSVDELAQEQSIRDQLEADPATAYLQQGDSDLRLIEIQHGLSSTTTRFQQVLEGIPVYGAFVTVNQGPKGEVQQIFDQGYGKLEREAITRPQISAVHAENQALRWAGAETTFAPSRGELVWYPNQEGTAAEAAWQVTVYATDPVGDYLTVVSNETGRVVFQENRAAFATGSGLVYYPNPYQQEGSNGGGAITDNNDATNATLDGLRINVTLQGLNDATGYLIGEFADLATLNSPSLPDMDAFELTRIYQYNRDDPRFEQVVVYHTIDSINRYFHTLGFDDDSGPTANGIRDFPTLANAHWDNADNSFYSTGDDAVHFGDGGVDDAEDGDIVAHEYGHAVQHDQNAAWGGGEMGAMGEGFGDYLAASFFADFGDPGFQSLHAAAVGEWDATSYSGDNPPNLRRVDGDKVYPDDLVGQVHADGEIWSAALWDIRAALGGPTTDQLVLESHFGLPGGATMPMAAEQILLADQNLNGGVNEYAIRQAFIDRGILEPPPTAGMVQLNRGFYQEIDTVTITLVDANAIAPVTVSISSDSGDVETVQLNPTGDPSLFEATIDTLPGSVAADGVLQVALGDTITVEYNDPDDGNGLPFQSTDTATISNIVEYPSTDVPVSIVDNTTVFSEIVISDPGVVLDLDVALDITHTWDSDLDVFLIGPDGTVVELFQDIGGSGDNFVETVLDDEADTSITSASAPFTGRFRPVGNLSDFDQLSITGTWTLSIRDDAGGDQGTLNAWSLFIDVGNVGLGSVDLDAEGYGIGDTVNILVLDGNATSPLTVDIESTSGDLETVALTDNGDGSFSASIQIAAGDNAADGILQGAIGDTITVSYLDADNGSGGSGMRVDTARIRNVIEYPSSDVPLPIEDQTTTLSTIVITDEGAVGDLDVTLDITHTWDSDLDVFLIGPDGTTTVELFQDVGGSGDNFTGTILDDEAATDIGSGSAPFTGSYRPVGDLADFDGMSITGTWTLSVFDDAGGDQGTLNAWSLLIDVVPVALPELSVAGPVGDVSEGDAGSSLATFRIELSEPAAEEVTVDYATTVAGYAHPATPGVDFEETSGTAMIAAGDLFVDVEVTVYGDAFVEFAEMFGLELSNPSMNVDLVTPLADATLANDDVFALGTTIDFGTPDSPIAGGAVGFVDDGYHPDLGMGWSNTVGHSLMEGTRGNNLARDFARMRSGTFSIDVANGDYDVTVFYGFIQRRDLFTISFEGGSNIVDRPARGFSVSEVYDVTVNDGQLNIDLLGLPGLDPFVKVSGIQVNASSGKSDSGGGDGFQWGGGGMAMQWAPAPGLADSPSPATLASYWNSTGILETPKLAGESRSLATVDDSFTSWDANLFGDGFDPDEAFLEAEWLVH